MLTYCTWLVHAWHCHLWDSASSYENPTRARRPQLQSAFNLHPVATHGFPGSSLGQQLCLESQMHLLPGWRTNWGPIFTSSGGHLGPFRRTAPLQKRQGDSEPDPGISAAVAGRVLPTLLFFPLVPSSYWVLHSSICSFPLVSCSSPLSAGVLNALLCLKMYSWCIYGERCTPCPPTPLPSCSTWESNIWIHISEWKPMVFHHHN